ncbi:type I restriction-modification enzyme R subunit C-terminal domain-containing protein [Leisingera aquimarina]|uniref:type I restriction-modification enzyme R subunit C-terminal domain-containing protein n=1 Tax=Leisingera aquimarina TaxID=476529 RepID=UPI001B7FC551|nr:type I restriction-modification enzyme R subunit C-terminal domain-containing protein [Leisingera aquimarina]
MLRDDVRLAAIATEHQADELACVYCLFCWMGRPVSVKATGRGASGSCSQSQWPLSRLPVRSRRSAFTSFVKNNQNKIAALSIVVQRPRELTRTELRNLRLELDKLGFSETSLRRAWNDASNEDIAASIIGFVRQAALGDPLIPFETRVQSATKAILAKAKWTDPQKTWLRRIAEQITKEIVVDRESHRPGHLYRTGGL